MIYYTLFLQSIILFLLTNIKKTIQKLKIYFGSDETPKGFVTF